jgi:hypothetical protein
MNGRRQLLRALGLGSLLTGMTAVVSREAIATSAKPHPTSRPVREPCPEYKVFTVAAGDSVEDAFNAVAREGFQYAGSAQRYGGTDFIFVKWLRVEPDISEDMSS